MSKVRVDQVTRARIAEQITQQDQHKQIKLFTQSKFETQRQTFAGIGKLDLSAISTSADNKDGKSKAKKESEVDEVVSIKLNDGTRLELPRLTNEQYSEIDAILSQTTPEQAEHLIRNGQQFAAAANKELEEGRSEEPFSLEASHAAQTSYESYVVTVQHGADEEAVHGAMLFGLYGMELNLQGYFDKVKAEQQVASDIRTDVAEIEGALADWPDDGSTETFDYREVIFNEDGTITVVEHKDVEMTKEQAQALVDSLKGQIESMGQFEQREMMELQQMVNRYQQAMNTLSNIMKNMHDTHRAVIGNIR